MDGSALDQTAIERLIQLATEALSPENDPDVTIARAEQYSDEFSAWFEANRHSIDDSLDAASIALIEKLNTSHSKVLTLMNELKTDTVKDLKSHQKKGKGMMAYLDVLPKKISVLKSRKG